ncbi:MAG: hypothetical protein IPO41_13780 [Acidobacteria bacterium]|nr:hypothetical protein [Acidobacteriota bacterium]
MLVEPEEVSCVTSLSEAGVVHDRAGRAKDGSMVERNASSNPILSVAAVVAVVSDIMSTRMSVLSFIFSIKKCPSTVIHRDAKEYDKN